MKKIYVMLTVIGIIFLLFAGFIGFTIYQAVELVEKVNQKKLADEDNNPSNEIEQGLEKTRQDCTSKE